MTLDVLTAAPTTVAVESPVAAPTALPSPPAVDPGVNNDAAAGGGSSSTEFSGVAISLIVIGVICFVVAITVVVWQRNTNVAVAKEDRKEDPEMATAASHSAAPSSTRNEKRLKGRVAREPYEPRPPPSVDGPASFAFDLDDEIDEETSLSDWTSKSLNLKADEAASGSYPPSHTRTARTAISRTSYQMAVHPKGQVDTTSDIMDAHGFIRLTDLSWDATDA